MTEDGYLVGATPHRIVYRSIGNFAGLFIMVCSCAFDFAFWSIQFLSLFFLTFELSHFGALSTIKVHYPRYHVCEIPPTVLY